MRLKTLTNQSIKRKNSGILMIKKKPTLITYARGEAEKDTKMIKKIKEYMKKHYSIKDGHMLFLFPGGYMLRSNIHHDTMVCETFKALNIEYGDTMINSFGIIRCGKFAGVCHIELDDKLSSKEFESLIDTFVSLNADRIHLHWKGLGWQYGDKLARRMQKSLGDGVEVYDLG